MTRMFNETSYFSDTISRGQSLYWAATVNDIVYNPTTAAASWSRAEADFRNKVIGEGFSPQFEINQGANSLAANVTAPGDFGSENDVKSILDGIANEAGFRLRASMIRAGARPLASEQPSPWSDPLGTASKFWGDEASKAIENLGGGTNLLLVAGIGLAAIFLLRR